MKATHSHHTLHQNRGDATRDALIQAAIAVFARDGFHAVSTRALSRAAAVNQALIGYHFGSKMGLYLAVFEDIVARLKARIGPLADALEQSLDQTPKDRTEEERRERFLSQLLRICDGILFLMMSDETKHWSQLIIREQQKPTAAFERFYNGFMKRTIGLITRLVQYLRDEPDPVNSRAIAVVILGHLLVWRAAREGVMRHMQWKELTEREIAVARAAVHRGIIALVFG